MKSNELKPQSDIGVILKESDLQPHRTFLQCETGSETGFYYFHSSNPFTLQNQSSIPKSNKFLGDQLTITVKKPR